MSEAKLKQLKMMIQENKAPFFDDEEILFHLNAASGDMELAAYNLLIIKAKNTQLVLAGITVQDQSKHFLQLAQLYQPNNSGILGD